MNDSAGSPAPFELAGRVAIVTGGAHGIGRAIAEALAARGARVAIADRNVERTTKIADRIGGLAVVCDVGSPDEVNRLVARVTAELGPVDVAVSNAGIGDLGPDLASTVEQIRTIVDANLMAHVWMAQAVVPGMVERGGGALIQTISSAALITGPSNMGYTLTKHGALGFAEWVALNYRHLGIRVVCLCPNAVYTGMLGRNEDDPDAVLSPDLAAMLGDVIEPEVCASMTLDALDANEFLVLPHPRVAASFQRKAADYTDWIDYTNRRLRRMRGEEV